MRDRLDPVFGVLPGGMTKADVAMAYTFKTQSVTGVSLQLSALPYAVEQGAGAAVFTPVAATEVDVLATYGVPLGPDIDSFWSVTTPTLDAIDPTTGALRPDLAELSPAQMAGLVKPLPALVAVPLAANVPSCPPPTDALHCAKVVIFEHGLGGGHRQMIGFANALAARGFVVAAIDFPLHGDRAYCSANTAATDCNDGGTCDPVPGGEGQGDPVPPAGQAGGPPGVCSNGNRLGASLTSTASGRYFVTGNFFRIRDAFRQNLVDQSALVLSMARPPFPLAYQPTANPLAAALLTKGIVIDPSAVHLEGISLGGIAGTQVLATNPRVTRGVLSVPGGTLTDVFTTAPAFTAQVDALFLSLGIDRSQIPTDPAVAARYLQTINVAKWILDPGDPVNFAKHVRTSPLPNLLSPTPALQSPKDAWGMVAQGDLVVPNPYNLLLFNDATLPFTTYTSNGGDAPHSLLATSATAQSNAGGWLFDLTNPGVAVDLTDIP
jgi:pimeloyl-ACP methyl ester carboxylesterase